MFEMGNQTLTRRQSTRMQHFKDESIMGDHAETYDMRKSMDTAGLGAALAVPDVYIHKRGAKAID